MKPLWHPAAIVTCKTCQARWEIAHLREAGTSLRAHYEHEHGGPYHPTASEPLLSQAWGSPGGTASRTASQPPVRRPSSPSRGFWHALFGRWIR